MGRDTEKVLWGQGGCTPWRGAEEPQKTLEKAREIRIEKCLLDLTLNR